MPSDHPSTDSASRFETPVPEAPDTLPAPLGDPIDVVLSDPITADMFDANTPYAIRDAYGRVFCRRGVDANWEWAYLGKPGVFLQEVVGVSFDGNPLKSAHVPTITTLGHKQTLKADYRTDESPAPASAYTFWSTSGLYKTYPDLPILTVPKPNDQFQLTVNFPSGRFSYLDYPAADGDSVWLTVNTKPSANYFTLHRLLLTWPYILRQLVGIWPYLTHENFFFYDGDESSRLQLVTDTLVKSIWTNSGLSTWTPFEYGPVGQGEYAFVFKGRASRRVYADTLPDPLALGMVLGRIGVNATDAYVANIFINYQGQAMLFNPKTGHIFAPGDWKDPKGTPIRPEQIVI